tara:strand:+ start:953 stop:1702 length:750 start_codon:yes stop_codon:yes gene_type:complete
MKTKESKLLNKLDKKVLKPTQLLLGSPRAIPEEVKHITTLYKRYGVSNTTINYLDSKKNEIANEVQNTKKKSAKHLAKNTLVDDFTSFRVVNFKSLHEVCVEHNLYMYGFHKYFKPIPEHVFESLTSFEAALRHNNDKYQNVKLITNTDYWIGDLAKYHFTISEASLERLFWVAAPLNHFKYGSYTDKVGQTLININEPRYKKKINPDKESSNEAPIVFVPIKLANQIYCIIVDSWDEEVNDERIRKMI